MNFFEPSMPEQEVRRDQPVQPTEKPHNCRKWHGGVRADFKRRSFGLFVAELANKDNPWRKPNLSNPFRTWCLKSFRGRWDRIVIRDLGLGQQISHGEKVNEDCNRNKISRDESEGELQPRVGDDGRHNGDGEIKKAQNVPSQTQSQSTVRSSSVGCGNKRSCQSDQNIPGSRWSCKAPRQSSQGGRNKEKPTDNARGLPVDR